MITEMYRSQTETAETAEIGVQNKPKTSKAMGTPSAPPPAICTTLIENDVDWLNHDITGHVG